MLLVRIKIYAEFIGLSSPGSSEPSPKKRGLGGLTQRLWNILARPIKEVVLIYLPFLIYTLMLMVPLAITSTKKWIGRLGGKRWQKLHRLIYLTALAGVLHYLWLVKLDIRRPLTYGAILAVLMAYRGWNVVIARKEREKAYHTG